MTDKASQGQFSGHPISWRTDIISVLGVTLLVAVLMWPALNGTRSLMSDSWRLNYPWAVEPDMPKETAEQVFGDAGYVAEEPYIHSYDIYLENIPWYAFAQSELAAGRWPHWNPYSFCGAPLYANHLVPLTHPPLMIALLVASPDQIHTVATFLTWWLAGIGLYFYLRRKRLQPTAGLTAVALYLTCGHFMPLVPFQMSGLMYYPWMLMACDALDERPTVRNLLFFALMIGMQFASGHPAYVVPFLYLLALHRILIWGFTRKGREWWGPRLGILILAFILGAGISAIQNYPTWKYLGETSRDIAGQTERALFNDDTPGQVQLQDTETPEKTTAEKISVLFSPIFQKEIELQHPFVGVPLVLLALIGLFYLRPPERNAMFVLLAVFTILAVPLIFSHAANYIPGLGISPYTPFAPAQFLLVILAGIGVGGLIDSESVPGKSLLWIITGLSLAGLIIFVWPFIGNALINPDTRWEKDQLILAVFVLITGIIAVFSIAIASWSGKRQLLTGGFILPLAVTVAGVLGHFYQYPVFQELPVMPRTASIEAIPVSDMYRVIRHSSKPPAHAGRVDDPLTFGGNLPMWAGTMDAQGYDSFVLKGQWDILRAIDGRSLAWNGLALPVTEPGALGSPILDTMAVKWVISDDPDLLTKPESGLRDDEYELIHSGGLVIYERLNALPRWYLSDRPVFAGSFDEALEMLTGADLSSPPYGFPFAPGVIIESEDYRNFPGEEKAAPDPAGLPPGSLSLVEENPQYLEFSILTSSDRWLVLSDAYYPEWRAYVDGEEAEIFKANGAYRGIRIPSGNHMVQFKYDPADFRTGVRISFAVLLLLIIGSIIEHRIRAAGTIRVKMTA